MRVSELETTILNEITLLIDNTSELEELSEIWDGLGLEAQKEVVRGILEEFERGTTNNDIARMVGTQASSQGSSLSNPNVPTLLDIIEKLRLDRDSLVAENTNGKYYHWDDRNELEKIILPKVRREFKAEIIKLTESRLVLIILIFILCIEWTIRRFKGLV